MATTSVSLPSIREILPDQLKPRQQVKLPQQRHYVSQLHESTPKHPYSFASVPTSCDKSPSTSAHEPECSGVSSEDGGEGYANDGGKKHVCPTCGKRFNRPSSLKIHLNTHSGITPYACPFPSCGRQFNVNSNMRRHYRNHTLASAYPYSRDPAFNPHAAADGPGGGAWTPGAIESSARSCTSSSRSPTPSSFLLTPGSSNSTDAITSTPISPHEHGKPIWSRESDVRSEAWAGRNETYA
ncbi:hypothetical protein C8J57DRAFT_1581895 [Mycena rebaudengoi]|nr:hypothetical protein C8J57DRAFT_1581895 [Mycena rebaudengoi]